MLLSLLLAREYIYIYLEIYACICLCLHLCLCMNKSIKENYPGRAVLPKIDNAGGSELCWKGTFQVCDHIITTTSLLQQKHGEKYLKFKVDPLTVTQKKFFTFCDAKFVMIHPMLRKLKQTSAFSLTIIKGNANLFEKENRMYHKSVFIHSMYKIVAKVLMIGNSLYLRSVKHANNLKKGSLFGNTN